MMRNDVRGNVSIEFIAISIFLLIPICYLAVCASGIAQTFLTMTSAARTSARVFVTQENDNLAHQRSAQIAREQLRIGQLASNEFSIRFVCSERPCLTPSAYVTATIKGSQLVVLPLIQPVKVSLTASQTIEVDAIR
jgi:Flp pilus assembly protein TadG